MSQANHRLNEFIRRIITRTRKHGLYLHPFFLTVEDIQPDARPVIEINPAYTFRELNEDDLPLIHALRPDMDIERYGRFLREGKRCFGLIDKGHLIAKMWIDFDHLNTFLMDRPLNPDEAYLFDAFSNPDYRGQNLAPYLRLRCYDAARAENCQKIYSVTDFINTAARGFKAKLGAKQEGLYLVWQLRRYGFNQKRIKLRSYAVK